METTLECCKLYQTNSRRNIYENSSSTAIYFSQTIQKWRAKDAGYLWLNKDKLIRVVFLRTPALSHISFGPQAKLFIYQLCENTGWRLENLRGRWLIKADGEREREREGRSQRNLCGQHSFMVNCLKKKIIKKLPKSFYYIQRYYKITYDGTFVRVGISDGIIVRKIELQTFTIEHESLAELHSYALMLYPSKHFVNYYLCK